MFDIRKAKLDLEEIINRRNSPSPDGLVERLQSAWFAEHGVQALAAAEKGLEVSLIAACAGRKNTNKFLRKLFEKCTSMQILASDGVPRMARDLSDVGLEQP